MICVRLRELGSGYILKNLISDNKTRKARREQEEEAASETSETSNDDAKKRKMNDNDAIGCSRTM